MVTQCDLVNASENLTKMLHIAWLSDSNMIVTSAFQGENPIYKSAVTTVVNPKYEGKWWRYSFQWTLLSSIWQLQYLLQVWGLTGTFVGIYVFSSCRFTIIMYYAATAPIFLLTPMIYMHFLCFRCTVYVYILLSCILAEMMTWRCFFLATGLVWKEDLVFFNNTIQNSICTRISQLLSLSQTLLFLSLPLLVSLCTDFLCVSVCSRRGLSLLCKFSAVATHYVNMCVYI